MDNFTQPQQPLSKLLRVPNLKRGKQDDRISDRIKLEKVLGVTVTNNAALASDRNTGTVAYPAGCTVVLFNTTTGQQSHIINTSKKSISSVAFSSCGRYLVTGECGHQPGVRVWDLQSDPQPPHAGLAPQIQQVAEFVGHKYGISCVAFSPTNKYVVSIGTQHDMIVNVWDWKNNIKVASNKVSTKVKSIAFAENGSYFVTVGNRHVKFWFLEYGKNKYNKEAVPLMGRSAILGEQRNNYFCDVACGKNEMGDSTYAITRSGLLCEFNNRRLLDKWVELRTTSANCITVGKQFIFVGCADGIVRCFNPSTLKFVTTLPRTHYLGVDVTLGLNITHMSSPPPEAKYPDTTAITYDETGHKLTCIYNDHSVYVWDVHNIKRVGKSHSFLYHSACIWGVEMAPPKSSFPAGSFLTCSSDDTIRVWNLDKINDKSSKGIYRRNIYSNELLKVVYVDKNLTFLKELDASIANEKQDSSYDGRNGVRSIRLSPDGNQLASGDREGNIRIHETTQMSELLTIEAHDAEVLCLEYSEIANGHNILASASRDRLIHVFDVKRDYNFLQTLDDHSSSITAVRFLTTQSGNLQMVSCGADKSLIFRSLGGTPNGTPQFQRGHNATGKTTLYDMEIDAGQKHVLTACQDRNVRIYSVGTGKHTKSFKGSTGDDGTLIKIVLDKSGIYLATSCTDKSLSVYDYYTGECMATMCGHSELATGLRFTNDCRRLISASGDGCIFVWRVPHDMVVTMHARLSQQAMRLGKTLDHEIFGDNSNVDFYEANNTSSTANIDNDYRFSIGQLPLWAKKHISDDVTPTLPLSKGVATPQGRWAQRAERVVAGKSPYTDSVIPFPSLQGSDGGSKDSSLESTTEIRQYTERTSISKDSDFVLCEGSYNEIMSKTSSSNITLTRGPDRRSNLDSPIGSLRDPDLESAAHDGDIDSDQEFRQLYFPKQIDSANSGSEFNITIMDADELRRSIRKTKNGNNPTISIQPTSISTGSQDSDDDEDEVSTPSGENTDRNPLSMLSVSSESLDQMVNREKYLQSTFESLSGAEMDSPANKSSISSQFHTRGGSNHGSPNVRYSVNAAINATKQTRNDLEATKKREELQKRIADTKKKLQSIGYNSPLKYSQSIADLSHIPEKDKWSRSHKKTGNDINSTSDCYCNNSTILNNQFQINKNDFPYSINNTNSLYMDNTNGTNFNTNFNNSLPTSFSVPTNLQLCGCYMQEINKNTNQQYLKPNSGVPKLSSGAKLSDILSKSPENSDKTLAALIRPRKLKLDKTLNKYKHKSLPVSPVSEECRLADFVDAKSSEFKGRRSFSYYVDLDGDGNTDEGFKKICDDIERFSKDFSKNYEQIEDIFKGKSAEVEKIPEFVNLGKGFEKISVPDVQKDYLLQSVHISDDVGKQLEFKTTDSLRLESTDLSTLSMKPVSVAQMRKKVEHIPAKTGQFEQIGGKSQKIVPFTPKPGQADKRIVARPTHFEHLKDDSALDLEKHDFRCETRRSGVFGSNSGVIPTNSRQIPINSTSRVPKNSRHIAQKQQNLFDSLEPSCGDSNNKDLKVEVNYDDKLADFENIQFYRGNEEEEANFSSDSLEDCSFKSAKNAKLRKIVPPRRCVSNDELSNLQNEEVDASKYHHCYDCDGDGVKSESFYLNQSNRNSQESILSDDNMLEDDFAQRRSKSYCNSLESVISNDSDCKSAPLEILFAAQRASYSQSLPKSHTYNAEFIENARHFDSALSSYENPCFFDETTEIRRSQSLYYQPRHKVVLKTSQTQTDFACVTQIPKKSNISADFQQKLLKFETITQNDLKSNLRIQKPAISEKPSSGLEKSNLNKKGIAFFVEGPVSPSKLKKPYEKPSIMCIPSMDSKNKQYNSKFCNILNNKPEINLDIFEQKTCKSSSQQKLKTHSLKSNKNNFALTKHNFDGKHKKIQETSSLDRHLLARSLLESEKITHKPPKATRRHSSKTRKKTYEYVRKEDFKNETKRISTNFKLNNKGDENLSPNSTTSNEKTIEFSFKEKNLEKDLDHPNLFHDLYDSLDKNRQSSKMDLDSLDFNINIEGNHQKLYDSLEVDAKQLWNAKYAEKVTKHVPICESPKRFSRCPRKHGDVDNKPENLHRTRSKIVPNCLHSSCQEKGPICQFKTSNSDHTESYCQFKTLNYPRTTGNRLFLPQNRSPSPQNRIQSPQNRFPFSENERMSPKIKLSPNISQNHQVTNNTPNTETPVSSDFAFTYDNIKLLNEIQKKIDTINNLVGVFKKNVSIGKVRALSCMYENLNNARSYYNDLNKMNPPIRYRRRNLSLPNFLEGHMICSDGDTEKSAKQCEKSEKEDCGAEKGGQQIVAAIDNTDLHASRREYDDETNKCVLLKSENTDLYAKKLFFISPKVDNDAKVENADKYEQLKKIKNVSNFNKMDASNDSHSVRIDDTESSPDSSLRRACSLSDLSVQGPVVQKRRVDQVSGKIPKNPQVSRISSRNSKFSNMGMRSNSTGVLNASDSDESDKKSGNSRLMRPTISSQNKAAGSNIKSVGSNRGKRMTYSSMDLSSIGQLEDSSSEEIEKPVIVKPAVPPRTRIYNSDNTTRRHAATNGKEKPKPMKATIVYDKMNQKSVDLDETLVNNDSIDPDVSSIELSTQLCDEVALQLTKAANNVVEVYTRLQDPDYSSDVPKSDMVKNLELSIATTQKMLQDITLEKLRQSNFNVDVNQTDTVKKLNDLISKGFSNDPNAIVNIMQQYSDILLGMMQQKIQDSSNT